VLISYSYLLLACFLFWFVGCWILGALRGKQFAFVAFLMRPTHVPLITWWTLGALLVLRTLGR
jgi:hypothetical protein